MFPKKYIDIAI